MKKSKIDIYINNKYLHTVLIQQEQTYIINTKIGEQYKLEFKDFKNNKVIQKKIGDDLYIFENGSKEPEVILKDYYSHTNVAYDDTLQDIATDTSMVQSTTNDDFGIVPLLEGCGVLLFPIVAGKVFDNNTSNSIPVDVASPAPKLTLAMDTGISSTDSLTKTGDYVVEATAQNSIIEYSIDNIIWSTIAPVALEGANIIYVKETYTNGNAATAALNFTLDQTAPTAIITMDTLAFKAGETSILTISFSEEVVGFDVSDLLVENGTISDFATTDNMTYTATFIVTSNSIEDLTNTISISSEYEDIVGNTGTGATSANYEVDTITPTAIITMDDNILLKGETSILTISFSEEVVGFDVSDLLVENGTISDFATTDNITWTSIFTPTDNIEDTTNVITLANTYTDIVGNTGTGATSESYTLNTIDNTPASTEVFFLSSSTQQLGTNNFHATVVFDEEITDLTASDFIFTCQDGGGTFISSTLTQVSETVYSFDATYNIGGVNTTNIAFYLASNSYSDLYGNGGNYAISNALGTSAWW